jgi:hypothetical protein
MMVEAPVQDGWEYRLAQGGKTEVSYFATYAEASKAQADDATTLYRKFNFQSCLCEWKDGLRISQVNDLRG